jgi:hypothetical protein
MRLVRSLGVALAALALLVSATFAASFPDLVKDPADVALYAMDWTSRLPAGVTIASIKVSVNGDVVVIDRTAVYPASVLSLLVSGGGGFGFTGDPQIGALSVVTVVVTCSDGEIFSRSFNVIARAL